MNQLEFLNTEFLGNSVKSYLIFGSVLLLGLIFIVVTFVVFGLIILFSTFIHKKFSSNNSFKIFAKYFNILVLLFIALLILFTENNLTLTN